MLPHPSPSSRGEGLRGDDGADPTRCVEQLVPGDAFGLVASVRTWVTKSPVSRTGAGDSVERRPMTCRRVPADWPARRGRQGAAGPDRQDPAGGPAAEVAAGCGTDSLLDEAARAGGRRDLDTDVAGDEQATRQEPWGVKRHTAGASGGEARKSRGSTVRQINQERAPRTSPATA